MRTSPLTLVPLLLLVACDRGTVPPTAAEGVSLNFTNNPDNAHPRIVRFQDVFGYFIVDWDRSLFSIQAATDGQFGCNATPTFYSFLDVQDLLNNTDDPVAGRVIELVQGRGVHIAVYRDPAGWVAAGLGCDALLERKVAEGTGNLTYTDNDLLAFLDPSRHVNAFGLAAQGRLVRTDGKRAAYSGVDRCVWDGEDPASIRCTEKISF